MLTASHIMGLARLASFSIALAIPVATTAYADDEYGTGHETVIREAAASPAARAAVLALAAERNASSLASIAAMIDRQKDVVGASGAQDALAVEIYHPGSGTDW